MMLVLRAHQTWLTLTVTTLSLTVASCIASNQIDEPHTQLPATATAPTAPTAPTVHPTALADTEVAELLRRAVCWHNEPTAAECVPLTETTARAIEALGHSGDPRFIVPLVDMLWIEIGWADWVEDALETITGKRHANAQAWSAWVAEQAPPLPIGYAGWKGQLLSLVDHRFTELLADGIIHEPRVEELLWAGVRVEGLPPLNLPATVHRVEERYLDGNDVVFGMQIGDEARAYPERIIAWHGALWDEIDGTSILLLHCVPCGSAAAFKGKLWGRELRLVASGLVYRSRMLFTDEETGSLWDPVSGRAITGPAFENSEQLAPLSLRRANWGAWSSLHPTTQVLDLETGFVRNYTTNSILEKNFGGVMPLYPAVLVDKRLPAKELVLGIDITTEDGSVRHAYRLAALEAAGITKVTLGNKKLVLLSRGPGTGVAAYLAPPAAIKELVMTEALGLVAVDTEGERWFVSEEALVSTLDSARLTSVPTRTAYWFAWAGAWPATGLDDS